jgi:hypothetical protein
MPYPGHDCQPGHLAGQREACGGGRLSQPSDDTIYVIAGAGLSQETTEEGPPGEAVRIRLGRNHAEPVDRAKLLERFDGYTSLAEQMMERADRSTRGFRVEEITLHLGVSADVGIAFIGQAGIEAGIDVTLKRKPD